MYVICGTGNHISLYKLTTTGIKTILTNTRSRLVYDYLNLILQESDYFDLMHIEA